MSGNTGNSRIVSTITFKQRDPNQAFPTKPAVSYRTVTQVPIREPESRPTRNHNPIEANRPANLSFKSETDLLEEAQRQQQVGGQAIGNLVNFAREKAPPTHSAEDGSRKIDVGHDCQRTELQLRREQLYRERSKRTNSIETPPIIEIPTDEGVGSPTINIDCDEVDNEGDDGADEYYEDDEDDDATDPNDELTNLSRQSMMPLHELIAYYQYIQQENNQPPYQTRAQVSRQSSAASQITVKVNHGLSVDTDQVDKGSDGGQIVSVRSDSSSSKVECRDVPTSDNEIAETVTRTEQTSVRTTAHGNFDDEVVSQQQQPSIIPTKDRRKIRANVILELINSERDFVKHLRDVVDGYLHPARRHPEIFTGERINTIFSNIEQLYEFQQEFLAKLETCINWEDLAASQVGHCFLEYENGFSVYHYYCNNHPNAISELQDLYTKPTFVKFFEACRLLQNMIDISLDGFLLTPIQKICKYPLQLNELLKNTDDHHPDYENVSKALDSMRNCANLANERKRRIEALADVMSFQEKVENWFGSKLSDTSSILIHSGEVYKMGSHTWSQALQLYLFDHLLLYAKKDLLKRNSLMLKGRISMDTITEIADADEYKARKSFKLYCGEQQKWFVFTTRSEREKDEWIQAFERERNLVEADESEGFQITEREIGVARRALQNRKHSRSARYRHKRPDTAIVDQLDLDDANSIMNRTLSLPSCIHPSHVMNFVEDSRVVSTRKKSSSPGASSKSPNANPIASRDIQDALEAPPSGGSWFKKVGSKKLAKSQVYNVNGSRTTPPATFKPQAVSPTAIQAVEGPGSSQVNSGGANNFDQLTKRYRDHMVSEEQARLFRLNNDLPNPVFALQTKRAPIQPPLSGHHGRQPAEPGEGHGVDSNSANHSHLQPARSSQGGASEPPEQTDASGALEPHRRPSNSDALGKPAEAAKVTSGSFETTLMLSSGKVVRVREDAV